jgi:hypothetical protein
VPRRWGIPTMCDCCDHTLQHLIRGVLARDAAPIPVDGRTHLSLMAELRDALEMWGLEQEGTYKPGHSGGFPF